ncbi:hypothetical protein [Thermomonas carbonis]|uniref:Uncharacterized protein n=1 Tax=Thermomonas carbonis TaxID=1463158 RepID=A0A7G9SR81_9GAMM|nr:hypothetical protein [Thermomonas carbonis]QNN70356.1 hypothetical protein H9L16_01580 [Thermomonas carbonis]GHB99471.1 hypothetical protein GCM10010080_10380 [Thermomonas carbonis]
MSEAHLVLVGEADGTRYKVTVRSGTALKGVFMDGTKWETPSLPTIRTLDGQSVAYLGERRFQLVETGEILVPEADYKRE